MTHVEAIYRHGVFEPLEPVALSEDQRVRLSVEPIPQPSLQVWVQRAEALRAAIIERHGILPDSAPDIAADRLR
jgi:predicted DNA-binding antitoxin AbrB/MazE fold protein